jgi:hypothetical protein
MPITSTRRPRTQRRLEAKAEKAQVEKPIRIRRTSDQQIADLEKKIEQVKRRAAQRRTILHPQQITEACS